MTIKNCGNCTHFEPSETETFKDSYDDVMTFGACDANRMIVTSNDRHRPWCLSFEGKINESIA